ncbi:MAG TPA: hypothetical protein PKD85_02930 [Saprospiraceae bacterium]|nr:hypothetical protein [Saprospiraceae bacterium]
MKKVISIKELELINLQGGGLNEFCLGFEGIAGVSGLGLWAHWWNPVGWTAGTIGGIIVAGCLIRQL